MRDLPVSGEAFSSFKRSVFNDVVADWYGVYEVWWLANSTFGGLPLSDRLYVAERVVAELLDAGLVKLYRGTLGDASPFTEVPPVEYDALLASWDTWAIPDGPTVFIAGDEPPDSDAWQRVLDSL
jgi:hypothetical protein